MPIFSCVITVLLNLLDNHFVMEVLYISNRCPFIRYLLKVLAAHQLDLELLWSWILLELVKKELLLNLISIQFSCVHAAALSCTIACPSLVSFSINEEYVSLLNGLYLTFKLISVLRRYQFLFHVEFSYDFTNMIDIFQFNH